LAATAALAALRARSLALRGALALRVFTWFSRLLLSLSLRLPIKITFLYYYPFFQYVKPAPEKQMLRRYRKRNSLSQELHFVEL